MNLSFRSLMETMTNTWWCDTGWPRWSQDATSDSTQLRGIVGFPWESSCMAVLLVSAFRYFKADNLRLLDLLNGLFSQWRSRCALWAIFCDNWYIMSMCSRNYSLEYQHVVWSGKIKCTNWIGLREGLRQQWLLIIGFRDSNGLIQVLILAGSEKLVLSIAS